MMSRCRPRLVPVLLLSCTALLAYFIWFDAYVRSARTSLIPTSSPFSSNISIPTKPPRILLVSAFFPLEHSKHTLQDYKYWINNLLGAAGIHSDIYFYTTPSLEPFIRSIHASSGHTHELTIDTTFLTPISIPPLSHYQGKYTQMHAWDRESNIHSPELYAIWNAKPWLLSQAVKIKSLELAEKKQEDQQYDYAFWNDAGSFRWAHAFRTWPDPLRLREVFRVGKALAGGVHDVLFFPLCQVPGLQEYVWKPHKGPVDMDFSEASFFGSTPSAISWFSDTFYEIHNHYISTCPTTSPLDYLPTVNTTPPFHFVGKDQTLINVVMFQHPKRFIGVIPPQRQEFLPPMPQLISLPHQYIALTNPPTRWIPYLFSLTNIYIHLRAYIRVRLPKWILETPRLACGGDWFYYQWWLASGQDRRDTESVQGWSGSGDDGGCVEARVVSVEGILNGMFGSRWVEGRKAAG